MERRSIRSSNSIRHRSRSRTSLNNSSSHEHEGPSFELEDARQRSYSVDDGGQGIPSVEEGESSRSSSIGHQNSRHSAGNHIRRSLFQRNGRPTSCAKNRLPSTVEAATPSSVRASRTSSIGIVRAESPYQGATGPSHPYAMYSQDTNMSRAPSTATTSTVQRPERSYSGPRGPTQPYAMFPQNTVSEDDQESFGAPNNAAGPAYPTGARPAPQPQHRRIGPDGEDLDDLIGPDGYAEQLPPYTRYPNDIPPKRDPDASSFTNASASAPVSNSNPALENPDSNLARISNPNFDFNFTSNIQQDPPASTIHPPEILIHPHNTYDEGRDDRIRPTWSPNAVEPAITTPRSNPFSDTSTQESATVIGSNLGSEKGSLKQRAQRLPKKRICWGVLPCWLLAVLIVICLAILVGGIIGGVLAHNQGVKAGVHKALQTAPAGPSPADS